MGEYEIYLARASSFWQKFGNELLTRLVDAGLPICEYRRLPSRNLPNYLYLEEIDNMKGGITFEQIRYKRKKVTRTEWLQKPFTFKKKTIILFHRILNIFPVHVRAKGKKSYGQPKDFVYAYFILIDEKNIKHEWSPRLYFIEALWNGMLIRKKQFDWESEGSFPNGFALPRSIIASINRCLSCNYLPELWIGKRYAGWIHTDENASVYMGVYPYGNKNSQEILPLITELCKYPAGAVLLAYTCFSILKPFFLTYHQLDKKSSYLKVKKHINEIISINIRGYKPEYAENLARACCSFFDSRFIDKIAAIIDGIDIQPLNSKSLPLAKLTVDRFESKILQPACVLWLNREPAAELLQSGRIIDVYTEPLGKHKEYEMVSEYIVEKLSWAIQKKSEQGMCDSFNEISKETTLVESFLEEIEKYADNQTLARILSNRKFDIAKVKEHWHGIEPAHLGFAKGYVKSILRRINRCIGEYIDKNIEYYCEEYDIGCQHNLDCVKGEVCPGKSQCKFWQLLFKEPSIQALLKIRTQAQGIAKKYILELGRIDRTLYKKYFTYDSQHRAAIQSIKQIPASRYLDDNMVKKLAYLSASFRIFEEMCLPKARQVKNNGGFKDCLKEESMCLSKKIDKALVSVVSKQMLDSPTNILERYILNQISSGHFARIRGKRSDDNDVTIWYDPGEKLFFLRSRTYYEDLRKEHNLQITKSQFEDELARDNVIEVANRKKGDGSQMRRSFEIKVAANGNKESVLKIRMGALSNSFAAESAVKKAIESMSADMTPYRGK